jgi:hypothetical protein
MATYHQIQKYVRQKNGFMPKTCWIAHVKEVCCLLARRAHNRKGPKRAQPCPPDRVDAIKDALRHFGMACK